MFDPQTAYSGDWQYFDDVVDAKFHVAEGTAVNTTERATNQSVKVRPLSVSSREFREFSRAFALRSDERVVVVWAGSGTLTDLIDGDRLRFDGADWYTTNASKGNRGYWVASVRKAT